MVHVAAISILALTVSLSLARPRIGAFRIHHSDAAVIGAFLTLALGLVPLDLALVTLGRLSLPVLTIVSLMIITVIAERVGLLQVVVRSIARAANGNARRLLGLFFFSGAACGAVFTNDAAVLIFTPLACSLVEQVREDGWQVRNEIPYYFAVLYVANLAAPLVIGNPINIVVASIFDIGFTHYAIWMAAPAAISMLVTYWGLCLFFRKQIPSTCRRAVEHTQPVERDPLLPVCAAVLLATLFGFFLGDLVGVPVWAVAATGAAVLLALHAGSGRSVWPVVRGVGWDVIVFVVGIFIVVLGLRNAGAAHYLGKLVAGLAGEGLTSLSYGVGLTAGVCSAVMNNHPTADLMSWVIQDFSLPSRETNVLVFSSLIGGDLGPKMLPIGSLAALMWFRILRDRGIEIPYMLYIRVGIPVSLAAIFLSIFVLNLQLWLVEALAVH